MIAPWPGYAAEFRPSARHEVEDRTNVDSPASHRQSAPSRTRTIEPTDGEAVANLRKPRENANSEECAAPDAADKTAIHLSTSTY